MLKHDWSCVGPTLRPKLPGGILVGVHRRMPRRWTGSGGCGRFQKRDLLFANLLNLDLAIYDTRRSVDESVCANHLAVAWMAASQAWESHVPVLRLLPVP